MPVFFWPAAGAWSSPFGVGLRLFRRTQSDSITEADTSDEEDTAIIHHSAFRPVTPGSPAARSEVPPRTSSAPSTAASTAHCERVSVDVLRCILSYFSELDPIPLACAAAHPSVRLAAELTATLRFPHGASRLAAHHPAACEDGAEPYWERHVSSESLRGFLAYAERAWWWWHRPIFPFDRSLLVSLSDRSAELHLTLQGKRGRTPASTIVSPEHIHTLCKSVFGAVSPPNGERCVLAACVLEAIRWSPVDILCLPEWSAARSISLRHGTVLDKDVRHMAMMHHLRVLDLSFSTVDTIAALENHPTLERLQVKGCAGLQCLSPAGLIPQLKELIASQSAVRDVAGLERSTSLTSISLYGCLGLSDLSALGRIPSLQEIHASESTASCIEGLRHSQSLVRIGLRYCDLITAEPLAAISTLRVLNLSSTPLESVSPLIRCCSLTHLDISGCAKLRNLSPLGNVPTLEVLNASNSGAADVSGLYRSPFLHTLTLANCASLQELGPLGSCASLTCVNLCSSDVRSIEGLRDSCTVTELDISFCRRLHDISVLQSLPSIAEVRLQGCPGGRDTYTLHWLTAHAVIVT